MNRELTLKLYEKYPAIFANRCGFSHGDGWFDIIDAMCEAMSRTYSTYVEVDDARAKAWGIEPSKPHGLEKPRYFMEVEAPQVVAAQVKEKLATLRFYHDLVFEPRFNELAHGSQPLAEARRVTDNFSHFIDGIVGLGEVLSARTCEDSGRPGELHTTAAPDSPSPGWLRTLNREFAKTDPFCLKRNYRPVEGDSSEPKPKGWRLRINPYGSDELLD